MVKDNDADWTPPRRKPIARAGLDRAIRAEEDAAAREHQAQDAWYDLGRGTVMVKLRDGRVFGAGSVLISSLRGASPAQLGGLRASDDGAYLVVEALELRISVDGLVTRLMEGSPLAVKRSGARLAGLATSPAKGRPRRATGGWADGQRPSRRRWEGGVSRGLD